MGERIILHCDLNSFYASVELLDKPALWEVPVLSLIHISEPTRPY